MSIMKDINAILAEIKGDLDKVDLTKKLEVKEISKMGKVAVERAEKENFGPESFDKMLEMFAEANTNVGTYNYKDEYIKAVKLDLEGKKTEAKELEGRADARKEVKEKIEKQYDLLTKKKAVIDAYKDKFDLEEFQNKQKDKIDTNTVCINENKERIIELIRFKNNSVVKESFKVINQEIEIQEKFKELELILKNIENLESRISALANDDPKKKIAEDMKKENENKRDNLCKNINTTYKKSLDPKTIKAASIGIEVANAKAMADLAVDDIKKLIDISETDLGYKKGFKNYINEQLNDANTPKEFMEKLNGADRTLQIENIRLTNENKAIRGNISEIQKGLDVRDYINSKGGTYQPTDAEIDAEANLPAVITDKKEIKNAIYEYLKNGAGIKDSKFHPWLFLKSRFSRNAAAEWEAKVNVENKEAREKAKEKLIKDYADKYRNDTKIIDDSKNEFLNSLYAQVEGIKDPELLKKMAADAEKSPEAVLHDTYEGMNK